MGGLALPATHLGFRIDNNIICGFKDKVDTGGVAVPGDKQLKRLRLAELALETEQKEEAVWQFDLTPDGKMCGKLK